ncbi:MAG: HD domain-containing phosphohydrolase [Desulfuromonadales bacterium]
MSGKREKLGTVLVVDDTPENIDILKGLLSAEFNVKIATNGANALSIAELAQPDVILLDIMMPGMDGYEVCECLKKNRKTLDIPVIFVTALGEISDEEKGFNVGCVDYLTKPISPTLALARVKTHTALRKAQKELSEWNSNLKSRVISNVGTIRGQVEKVHDLEAKHKGGSVNSLIIAANGLFELLEARHATHANVVSKLVTEAARSMSLDYKTIRSVALGGLLHDIGKISQPDYVIEKPITEMTENELKDYQQHPIRSQFLFTDNEELSEVSLMVRHHHEGFNGSGFPDGLKGDEIPLGARMIAIADSIDHAAARVKTDKAEYAISKLAVMAGSQIDPHLIKHFRWATRAVFFQAIRKSGVVSEIELPHQELISGMQVARDLVTGSGMMLATKGTVLESVNIALIRKYYVTDPPPHGIFVVLKDMD